MLLVGLALVTAWLPVETAPYSGGLLAIGVGMLVVWRGPAGPHVAATGVVFVVLALSGFGGWDTARAISQSGLLAGGIACWFLASRRPPRPGEVLWMGVGLALLGGWGLVQVVMAPPSGAAATAGLPASVPDYVQQRLEDGRAFAAQVTPGHLAVVLTMALGLLFNEIGGVSRGWYRQTAAVLAWGGLILTRSPVGVALGVGATAATAFSRSPRRRLMAALLAVVAAIAVLAARPDARRLEPLRLRADNWRTAVWTLTTAPVVGVGFGSFAQASQKVPFEVGNRPAHAHSLPLELCAELGVVGLAVVALGAAGLGWLLVRLWPQHAGLAAAVAAVPLHNLVDFSLFTSSVALPWAVVLGWSTAIARGAEVRRRRQPPSRLESGAIILVIVLAVSVVVLHQASRSLDDRARGSATPAVRLAAARLGHRLAPWRLEPVLHQAITALDVGEEADLRAAAADLGAARWLRPHAAAVAELRGRLAVALGDRLGALAELCSAASARPFDPAYRRVRDDLLDFLETPEQRDGR